VEGGRIKISNSIFCIRFLILTLFISLILCVLYFDLQTFLPVQTLTCLNFSVLRLLTVDTIFCSSWDECPANLWTIPAFSDLATMTFDDLTHPVAVAATAQVKLCLYDKEERHIWFRLIETQL
jgi:hypothetical protein